jgi:hypothetical protein
MQFGLFNNFGAKNSVPVFEAFEQGLKKLGLAKSRHDMSADVAVIWSVIWADRMRDNHAVWSHFRSQGRPVVVLEVGLLKRDRTWKVGVNGTGLTAYSYNDLDTNRANRLGLGLSKWSKSGSDIVIAAQRTDSEQWAGLPSSEQWLSDTVTQLRLHTDRNIVVRPHPRQIVTVPKGCTLDNPQRLVHTYDGYNFQDTMSRAWAVVNWNSGPGSQSVIAGIPAFVGPDSLAAPVGNLDWSTIESPAKIDRDQWLIDIAHTEWTVAEIATGEPLARLLPRLQSF